MFEQEFLDLSRVDVLSAPDHHVLAASGDPNVAILVHDAQVAGVQPIPLVYGLACPLFIVPVAVHDHETPEAKFALGAKRAGLAFVSAIFTSICGCTRPTVATRCSNESSGVFRTLLPDSSVIP